MRSCLCIFVVITNVAVTNSLDILGVFPHPGKSHVDVFLSLMTGLAEKGHNVTVLSYFPLKEPQIGYRDVNLRDSIEIFEDLISFGEINTESRLGKYMQVISLKNLAATTCEAGMSTDEFKAFFRSKGKYDVMLVELFNTDCFLGLAEKFRAQVIGLSSCTVMPWYNDRFGNPSHTGYIPNNLLPFSDRMSFFQRFENTIATLLMQLYYDSVPRKSDKKIAKDLMGTNFARIDEYIKNLRLLLTNTHFTLNLPKPLAPNVIEIAGVHVGHPNSLPKDIDKWITDSKAGVIYMSMGSLLKGHTLPKEKKAAFLNAFSRLPQRVLWKWENESMEDKPDNVMIQKWMPQFDILSHPNVKAFISHGGLLSTIESVHSGVPMVVMPQFGDQHTNARAIESNGGGVILPLNEVTEESVTQALKTVLSINFRLKAKQLSQRFRDRPLPPLETAIYWIEYVARYKGATHMKTAAVDMPFYQYYLLDVFGFLLLILTFFVCLIYYTIKLIIGLYKKSARKIKVS